VCGQADPIDSGNDKLTEGGGRLVRETTSKHFTVAATGLMSSLEVYDLICQPSTGERQFNHGLRVPAGISVVPEPAPLC
jgi:hypothetical protein